MTKTVQQLTLRKLAIISTFNADPK